MLQATAQDFATKLYTAPEVSKSSRFSKPKMSQTAFTVDHYAGQVSYKTDNFLAKNKDFVVAEHQALMQNSTVPYVRDLFPPDPEDASGQVPVFPSSTFNELQLFLSSPSQQALNRYCTSGLLCKGIGANFGICVEAVEHVDLLGLESRSSKADDISETVRLDFKRQMI